MKFSEVKAMGRMIGLAFLLCSLCACGGAMEGKKVLSSGQESSEVSQPADSIAPPKSIQDLDYSVSMESNPSGENGPVIAIEGIYQKTGESHLKMRAIANQFIVVLQAGKTEVDLSSAIAPWDGQIIESLGLDRFYLIQFPVSEINDVKTIGESLRGHLGTLLENFDLNGINIPQPIKEKRELVPTGSRLDQNNVRLTSQSLEFPSNEGNTGDWDLDMVRAGQAWAVQPDCQGVKIAVIDSGVSSTHVDLAGSVNVDSGFPIKDGSALAAPIVDGHGTYVTCIISAKHNSAVRDGICPGAEIVPIRVEDGTASEDIKGLYHALDMNVDVVNYSRGDKNKSRIIDFIFWTDQRLDELLDQPDPFLQAIERLGESNVVFVTSAGNENHDLEEWFHTPVSYKPTTRNMITVGAVESSGNMASFSNHSANYVDISAPGVAIKSCWHVDPETGEKSDDSFVVEDGTSASAPYVTGAVGLYIAHQRALGNSLVAEEIRDRVMSTATTNPKIYGMNAGSGVLNIERLIKGYTDIAGYWQYTGGVGSDGTIISFEYYEGQWVSKRVRLGPTGETHGFQLGDESIRGQLDGQQLSGEIYVRYSKDFVENDCPHLGAGKWTPIEVELNTDFTEMSGSWLQESASRTTCEVTQTREKVTTLRRVQSFE